MTDYGITPAGFVPKPDHVIESEITADFRSIPGLESIQTVDRDGAATIWGVLIAILTEREAFLWALMLLVWQSAFRAFATGFSLDNTLSLIGKSRKEQRRSSVTLRLFNYSSDSPVTVLTGAQARQGTTGVIWETTADAEIPAQTVILSGLALGDIEWVSGTTVRAYVGTADLSSVVIGDQVELSGCTNTSNDGVFIISDFDDTANWVEYSNPDRTNATDDETGSPGEADIISAWIDVPAQSYSFGPYEASPGSIQQIVTPQSGWDAVDNTDVAQVGRTDESDTDARIRAAKEHVSASGGPLEATRIRIAAVPGVTYVYGRENDTDEEVDGLPAHSVHFVVVGGLDQDVVNAIGLYKGGGISTYGTSSGTYTDTSGNPHSVFYSRVTEKIPYLDIVATTDADFPSDGFDQIKTALSEIIWIHGQDLLNHRLIAAASIAVPGIVTITINQSWTASPVANTNLSVAATEVVNISIDRITVGGV